MEKSLRKTLWKKVKLLKMSNFTFSHYVFYAIYILNSFNGCISIVVCSFFEFGTVSKWCIREGLKGDKKVHNDMNNTAYLPLQTKPISCFYIYSSLAFYYPLPNNLRF